MKKIHEIIIAISLFFLAVTILIVSWTRASVALIWQGNQAKPGLVLPNSLPDTSFNPADWKLPHPGALPGTWLYQLKKARLFLWLALAKEPQQDINILLSEANKDLSAFLINWQRQDSLLQKKAWEAGAQKLIQINFPLAQISYPPHLRNRQKDLSFKFLLTLSESGIEVDPLLLQNLQAIVY